MEKSIKSKKKSFKTNTSDLYDDSGLMLSPIVIRLAAQQQHRVCLWWGGLGTYYLYQFLNISLAKASSGKNITPVCTALSVCILIEQLRGSPDLYYRVYKFRNLSKTALLEFLNNLIIKLVDLHYHPVVSIPAAVPGLELNFK